ncbi:unnamed protein product [Ectocarpus sp. 6 AP-2014]
MYLSVDCRLFSFPRSAPLIYRAHTSMLLGFHQPDPMLAAPSSPMKNTAIAGCGLRKVYTDGRVSAQRGCLPTTNTEDGWCSGFCPLQKDSGIVREKAWDKWQGRQESQERPSCRTGGADVQSTPLSRWV